MENKIEYGQDLDFNKILYLFQETDNKFKEAEKRQKETDKQIKELGKQIGGLGNKFGSFTEGLFMPSLVKILIKKFQCSSYFSNYTYKDNGNFLEIDLFAEAEDRCYIVEIKSHLKDDAIEQLKKSISNFRLFNNKYRDKKIYGIITAVHYREEERLNVLENGFYFIATKDSIAKLKVPHNFKPIEW
jgi:hypothetical protein